MGLDKELDFERHGPHAVWRGRKQIFGYLGQVAWARRIRGVKRTIDFVYVGQGPVPGRAECSSLHKSDGSPSASHRRRYVWLDQQCHARRRPRKSRRARGEGARFLA